jgi:ABC-2 type transport system ATP-binding protein
MSDPSVEVRELVKRYPRSPVNAVDGISFSVQGGEVFGLLGPNGAGKTTTVAMLTTRARPTAGEVRVGGIDLRRDPVAARSRFAVVPQRSNLDRALSIRDNLLFHAAYHGIPPRDRRRLADELLDQFGLLDRANSKPDFISGGQGQRIMIARALMHEPSVLFLDEPSTGLDPAARLFVWDRLRELKERGVTLVLTTHDMNEAAELADRVAIMDHGKLLAIDTPEALVHGLPGGTTLDLHTSAADGQPLEEVLDALRALPGVKSVDGEAAADGVHLRLYVSGEAPLLVGQAAALLTERGLDLADVTLGSASLEDVFISLTGRALR